MSVRLHSRSRIPGIINPEIFVPPPPVGVTLNGTPAGTSVANSNPMTIANFVVNSGTDTALFVVVGMRAFSYVTDIKYNGIDLTFVDGYDYGGGNVGRAELWCLVNPGMGVHDIVVTMSNSEWAECGAVAFDHVDPVTPYINLAHDYGNGSLGTIAIANPDGNLLFAVVSHEGVGYAYNSQTETYNITADGNWWSAAGYLSTVGTPSIGWSFSSGIWAIIAISINASG